jgi:hypothetical protein
MPTGPRHGLAPRWSTRTHAMASPSTSLYPRGATQFINTVLALHVRSRDRGVQRSLFALRWCRTLARSRARAASCRLWHLRPRPRCHWQETTCSHVSCWSENDRRLVNPLQWPTSRRTCILVGARRQRDARKHQQGDCRCHSGRRRPRVQT